jgi:hypothetical protein
MKFGQDVQNISIKRLRCNLIQETDIHMSVGHFTHRMVAKQLEVLLIVFLDCKVYRPVVKPSKVLANHEKQLFDTRLNFRRKPSSFATLYK